MLGSRSAVPLSEAKALASTPQMLRGAQHECNVGSPQTRNRQSAGRP